MRIKVELNPESSMENEAASLITIAAGGDIQQSRTTLNDLFSMEGLTIGRTLDLIGAIQNLILIAESQKRSGT